MPLQPSDAVGIVRRWSALPGYPFHVEGEGELVKALALACETMTQAQALAGTFTARCPTPEQIRDAGSRSRGRSPKVSPMLTRADMLSIIAVNEQFVKELPDHPEVPMIQQETEYYRALLVARGVS